MNVSPALAHFGIDTNSAVKAVQQVREYIEKDNDGVDSAINLVDHVIGQKIDGVMFNEPKVGTPEMWAMHFAQAVVEYCIKQNCEIDNAQAAIDAALVRTEKFIMKPSNKWMFAQEEVATTTGGEVKAVSTHVDVKVEVKSDGKIKKGGKETLATALYTKYIADLNGAEYSNQAFIAILMKECTMSKAGATTYNYNMKKKFGGQIASKK